MSFYSFSPMQIRSLRHHLPIFFAIRGCRLLLLSLHLFLGASKHLYDRIHRSVRPSVGPSICPLCVFWFFCFFSFFFFWNQPKWGKKVKNDSPHLFRVSLSIFHSQSVFLSPIHNLSIAVFLSQSFFLNLSFTISLSQSFLHNISLTIFPSQSFFHILSTTIFLSQFFFLNLYL